MSHPLEDVINQSSGFVLIGDSSEGRFPGFSYNAYSVIGKRFYCLDLGGLTVSRGPTKGGRVYTSVDELPDDRDDLAIIWTKPRTASKAVDVAHEAGCHRVWFSFGAGHPDAVARAQEHGIRVVEVGRCPVYYLAERPLACRAHTLLVKATGLYGKPPRTQADPSQREMW